MYATGVANRCEAHGLAVGPDGRCVLCAREAEAAGTPSSTRSWSAVAAAVIAAAAIGVAFVLLRPTDRPTREVEAEARPELAAPPGVESPAGRAPRVETRSPATFEPPTPEPTANAAIEVDVQKAPARTEGVPAKKPPSAEDLAAALRSVRVTVYTTSWCPQCTRARNWLRANGIAHTDRDIEASESARRDRDRIAQKKGVPTVDIDGEVLTGFGEQSWSRAIARATERRLHQRDR